MTKEPNVGPETVEAVGYEHDDGTLYGYANHVDFKGNPGGIPVRIIRESDYQAMCSQLTAAGNLQVGSFTLCASSDPDFIFMSHESGEGGSFKTANLEQALFKFFGEQF